MPLRYAQIRRVCTIPVKIKTGLQKSIPVYHAMFHILLIPYISIRSSGTGYIQVDHAGLVVVRGAAADPCVWCRPRADDSTKYQPFRNQAGV